MMFRRNTLPPSLHWLNMAHVNSSEFSHPEEIARLFTHKSQQNNHATQVHSLRMAVHAPNDSNYGSCPQECRAQPRTVETSSTSSRPEVKKFRKQRGQGGGFTGNFRATPAPLQATSFVFPFQFTSVLFWATTLLFRSHHSFFGPPLFFSGNISFFGQKVSFQVT